jgi:hypothetical protein
LHLSDPFSIGAFPGLFVAASGFKLSDPATRRGEIRRGLFRYPTALLAHAYPILLNSNVLHSLHRELLITRLTFTQRCCASDYYSCFRLEGPDALPDAPDRFERDAAAFAAITSNELTERERNYWSLVQTAASDPTGSDEGD